MPKRGRGYKRVTLTNSDQFISPLGSALPKPQTSPFGDLGRSYGENNAVAPLGPDLQTRLRLAGAQTYTGPNNSFAPAFSYGGIDTKALYPSMKPNASAYGVAQDMRTPTRNYLQMGVGDILNADISTLTYISPENMRALGQSGLAPEVLAQIQSMYVYNPTSGVYQVSQVALEAQRAAAASTQTTGGVSWRQGWGGRTVPDFDWKGTARGEAGFAQGTSRKTGKETDERWWIAGKSGGKGPGSGLWNKFPGLEKKQLAHVAQKQAQQGQRFGKASYQSAVWRI